MIGLEAAVEALRHHHAAPADLAQLAEYLRLERQRPIAVRERGLEPEREALVDDRRRPCHRRSPLAGAHRPGRRSAAGCRPSFHIGERKAVEAEHLVDEIARRMRRVLARRDAQRHALRLDVGERLDAGARMHRRRRSGPTTDSWRRCRAAAAREQALPRTACVSIAEGLTIAASSSPRATACARIGEPHDMRSHRLVLIAGAASRR